MLKKDELDNNNSCLNRANQSEMLFVLLGRDAAAPETIRYWCMMRIKHGKNTENDEQIKEALRCADYMELQQQADKL